MAQKVFTKAQKESTKTEHDNVVRTFRINVPEEAVVDLRKRIVATIQQLAYYWQIGYDWRKAEAKLNALPQFITEIDGLDIHFIHVRYKRGD